MTYKTVSINGHHRPVTVNGRTSHTQTISVYVSGYKVVINMDSADEDAAAAIIVLANYSRKRCKKRTIWIKPWISNRMQYGIYHALVQELRVGDHTAYKNFLRMDLSPFHMLLDKVSPLIRKKDAHMRRSIPAEETGVNTQMASNWLVWTMWGQTTTRGPNTAHQRLLTDQPALTQQQGYSGEVTPPLPTFYQRRDASPHFCTKRHLKRRLCNFCRPI